MLGATMRRHLCFVLILVLATAARAVILFKSQTHVNHDEALIGLMGKHIWEGRYHPFYMYGQDYNAGAAWEAYLAAVSFAVLGVGTLPLKGCIVFLSLITLCLFYRMADRLHGRTAAVLATLVFALSPSLLQWHFQVRGYSFYFLSIPVLTTLFCSIESCQIINASKVFLFGLVSGLSLWCLELALALNAAMWILLAIRRKLSARNAMVGMAGFLLGYGPVILFNFTHQWDNWRYVFGERTTGMFAPFPLSASTLAKIFFREMPKFFGPATVYWYYPETPIPGVVFYVIALAAIALAIRRLVGSSSNGRWALSLNRLGSGKKNDLFMLVFTLACFVPYLAAPFRIPGYFLGGCVFLSVLSGRLLERCLFASSTWVRWLGSFMLLAVLCAGIGAIIDIVRRNQVDTLFLSKREASPFFLASVPQIPARIPCADIEAVQQYLRQNQISSVWTTIPFVYSLVFESGETLAVSDPILGSDQWFYPAAVSTPVSKPGRVAFVIDAASPYRPVVETDFAQLTGVAPFVAEYGTLIVVEPRQRSSIPK
jgi:hypothetical protein